MKFSRSQFIGIARHLEPKVCKCRFKRIRFCTLGDSPGCQLYRETGDCDHPYLPGPPCDCVKKLVVKRSLAQVTAILHIAFPKAYMDRPLPPTPQTAMDRETRVAMLSARFESGYSLFHPGDHITMPVAVMLPWEEGAEHECDDDY